MSYKNLSLHMKQQHLPIIGSCHILMRALTKCLTTEHTDLSTFINSAGPHLALGSNGRRVCFALQPEVVFFRLSVGGNSEPFM